MMNRREITEILKRFPYDRSEYCIITGSAMVMYGIREQTADIDLICSGKLADRLEEDGWRPRYTDNEIRWFRYGEFMEIFEDWPAAAVELMDGFQVISIEGLLEMKKKLGRKKDLEDIRSIEAFLKKQNPGNSDTDG